MSSSSTRYFSYVDWTGFSSENALAEAIFHELANETSDEEGITRECYSSGEDAALKIFSAVATAHQLEVLSDSASNIVVRMPEDDGHRAGHYIGSHADSVPKGGNYDGAAGIVAGLLCLIRLQQVQPPLATPVRLLMLRGEESAFYGRANIGSRALFGMLDEHDLSAKSSGSGSTLATAMEGVGINLAPIQLGKSLFDPQIAKSYLELHIEQGPVMIEQQWPAAIVSGIRGNVRHTRIVCQGEAGHSGAIPRTLRKDAVFAFGDLVNRLDEHWRAFLEEKKDLVVTIGMVGTDPKEHAISRIPGMLTFAFEARSQATDTLETFYQRFRTECEEVAHQHGVTFTFDDRTDTAPARMHDNVIERLSLAAEDCGIKPHKLPSGAGHDAAIFANAGIPSGMVFVRNAHGSHNPREAMDVDDLIKGTDILFKAITDW
ncbi:MULTISPECIES: hydantoinase/carbamoylase family amidase [Halomonas]|uniref:Hydantoinase/carbamoylase family amidase n=1 Tax=Halomonas citrativorans TaxID=2742612 RepID=A0ABR9FCI1_9GAMM|nr:hydantoinase/carbamoylase family amidase [Halomonas citrativorans]MBE0402905.1 hydantoinase/carbamoylase family amidase [Halomonas citrativorans]